MRIGLAYDLLRWEEKSLAYAIKDLGYTLELIRVPESVFQLTEPGNNELDLVFERCVSFYRALASSLALQEQGIPVVNSFDVIRNCGDKMFTTMVLAKKGIPVPRTMIAFDRERALDAAKKIGYPVVVKPIHGSWGRMIAKADDESSLLDIIDFRENMPSPHFQIHYIQEFIRKPGRDIRAYYVWGEVPVAIYRVSQNWKTNTALGARAEPASLDENLKELVIKAGDALGGGVLGVDLMEGEDGRVLVSEVNAVVEFKNTVRVTGYDLPRKIVSSTVEALRR
ncbi:MAG: lysine biosynthesis protein LysX [Candidatus Terraquivivens tikiterensis]|uniref:Lysine biosynthesis protein LysX n=1 Tax=Candidatus Terraquivivens tikiterensis TaxID=1980982 RepID=A0A2R7Y284_9ARCH|nr:MAG: lysine biosynthesis protein LysX [Candidatus Terraquivivens tikiterensis]